MANTLKFGFSPCLNDTFIFDALFNKKIDTYGLDFEFIIEDVERLNSMAFNSDIAITKISYYSFAQLLGKFEMMRSGGALGFNCGPLLISRPGFDLSEKNNPIVGIPGINTTANLLCSLAYPGLENKKEMLFSDIENALLEGEIDLGLIIHESRFTYHQKGLMKVADLGEIWEKETYSPIPLGGICIHSSFDLATKLLVESLIRQSVEYAFENRDDVMPFVKSFAQEMEESVMNAHIELYVNDDSIALGDAGEKGVINFLSILEEKNIIPSYEGRIFV